MKARFIGVCLVLLLVLGLTFVPAQAAAENDTDNHISADNGDWEIPAAPELQSYENGWIRDQKNLITNFYSMYQPEVVYVPEWDDGQGYPYLMWFFAWSYNQENDPQGDYPGYPGGDAIFLARAKALEGPWEIYSVNYETGEHFWDAEQKPFYWYPVITCQDVWYDSWHVGDPSVVYKEGVFYMAYSAMGCDEDMIPSHYEGDTDGNASCIMGAVSTDGINWKRSEKPLIIWDKEKGYNEKANPQEYMGGHQRPSLMFEDGVWKMWFDYKENQIGYAECSGDFLTGEWKEIRGGQQPLLTGVDFDVVKIGSVYYAYGDPYIDWYKITDDEIPYYSDDASRWSQRQIVEYQSLDGISWKATGWFRPDEGYDANQIPQVFLDHKENRVCIFYATQRGKRESSYYDWRWDNIRMMYRDIELFASGAEFSPLVTPSPSPELSSDSPAAPEKTLSSGTDVSTDLTAGNGQTQAAPNGENRINGGITGLVILISAAAVSLAAVAITYLALKRKGGRD